MYYSTICFGLSAFNVFLVIAFTINSITQALGFSAACFSFGVGICNAILEARKS